jgi:hypothetical protein
MLCFSSVVTFLEAITEEDKRPSLGRRGGGMRELDGHVVYVSRELDNVQGSHSDSSSSRATAGGDVQCDDVGVCVV